MANLLKPEKSLKLDTVEQQQEIQVPLKKQVPFERMTCQIHSSTHRKEEIKYINIAFIAKNKPEFCRTFLCNACLKDYRRKNPSNEDLKKIQSIHRFQYKYIESILEKYSDDTIPETSNLLEKAESQLCSDIDSLNQNFNQYCEIYKKNIKEIFQTLRKPCETNQVKMFMEGRMNQGMIEDFYKNYKTVNKYNVLIGNKNKDVLQGVFQGFQASMEKISKQFKDDMNLSFIVLKKYIQDYDVNPPKASQSERMIPESEQKRQNNPIVEERKMKKINQVESPLNTFILKKKTPHQEKQLKEPKYKKEMQEVEKKNKKRVHSSSSDSLDDSSDSNSSDSDNEKRRLIKLKNGQKMVQQKLQKDCHKHKAIQKQNRDKPFKNDRVYMIDQEFMKDSRNRLALYIVVKANTERSGAERVFRMDIQQFKRRYPEAFNRYVINREAGK